MGDANLFALDSATRVNGTVEVTGPAFDSAVSLPNTRDVTPDYMIVRYDDTFVAPGLERDVGVEATVYNKMMKGNRILVEVVGENMDEEYIADVKYEEAENLERGDTVFIQWNEEEAVLVPE